jgi:hypothetical protein
MGKLRHVLLSVVSAAAIWSTGAQAAEVNGTLKLTLTGTLRVAGTGYTTINCKAYTVLIPSTSGNLTLSAAGVLSWLYSADQSANAHAGFDYSTAGSSITGVKPAGSNPGSATGFTCLVDVPYTFTNAIGGESIAVMYDVTASDNSPCAAGYCPSAPKYPGGHTRQVQQIALPPTNGGVINVAASLRL